ncbi:MAG: transglycosylase domain-containing protein [Bryobacteraceae bacterium]
MPIETKPRPNSARKRQLFWPSSFVLRVAFATATVLFVTFIAVFAFYYHRYEKIVDDRISRPIFNDAAQIYAAPELVRVGDRWTLDAIASELRLAGYSGPETKTPSGRGSFTRSRSSIDVKPGPESYGGAPAADIRIDNGQVRTIKSSRGEKLSAYPLEPKLITGLFDARDRSKRRLLKYEEIPSVVRDAILAVEDRRFFEHGGINYVRLVEGVLAPILHHRRMQGGSTLTMQMARSFFLSSERSVHRKLAEILIAIQLEHRFTKPEIFAMYVNQVDMGQRGSFDIRGFGEAAQSYFGKDISQLNLPEAALLAGLVNGPSYYSPDRHPDRIVTRRNLVVRAMFDNHFISRNQLASAQVASLKLAPPSAEANGAPYFMDLVRDQLLSQYTESELNNSGMRVYTSLDPQLQKAAVEAVEAGLKQVDDVIRKQRTRRTVTRGKTTKVATTVAEGPMPQVALIAMDPHTGRVLALSGGRNYGASQLNHAVAKRPTGSIFKPFVYAAALSTGLDGDPATAFTEATTIDATEGTFEYGGGKSYSPRNFDASESTGTVTARQALAHSINTATVRVAEMIGYDKVAELAKAAGIESVQPTPAMAIGAYDSTPLSMASAYTTFANGGVYLRPQIIQSVKLPDAAPNTAASRPRTLVDPRVAFILTDMLQAVINEGTATEAVRTTFNRPAAGKTGTSHDAWFAGYTTNLLCVVWVGNDDYSDIKVTGAKAAAPIWTEFMVRAQQLQAYRDMGTFQPPDGVTLVRLDKVRNLPATSACPDDYQAYFITRTVPVGTCEHPNGQSRNFFQKMFGLGKDHPVAPEAPPAQFSPDGTPLAGQPDSSDSEQKPKKGFWHRIFRGKK